LLTSEVAAPWASRRMRARRADFSSEVRNLTSEGVCGSTTSTRIPKRTDMAPSTKKMKG
jgi:hypothetical protein